MLTAPPIDYMSDHEITSRLVRDACFNASVPNYVTHQWDPAPPHVKIPHLYYVDAIEGMDWYGGKQRIDFVVDISAQFERKLEMLACHDSQRAWLRKQHGLDEYLDGCRRWSAALVRRSARPTVKRSPSTGGIRIRTIIGCWNCWPSQLNQAETGKRSKVEAHRRFSCSFLP
ncbi:MAG: hypothetical protein U0872_08415 [Planctomycetaceae bacterium]